ncbi:unnamed protein product, partial [Closterium sp. NIES-64]
PSRTSRQSVSLLPERKSRESKSVFHARSIFLEMRIQVDPGDVSTISSRGRRLQKD